MEFIAVQPRGLVVQFCQPLLLSPLRLHLQPIGCLLVELRRGQLVPHGQAALGLTLPVSQSLIELSGLGPGHQLAVQGGRLG